MNIPDDVQLIQRCRSGDPLAIEALVERYQWLIFRLALSILDDPFESEEVIQDSFVAALGALNSYQGKSSFKTWLFAIVINKCRDRLRRRRLQSSIVKMLHMLFRENNPFPDYPEEQVVRNERDHEIRTAVKMMDEKYQLPIVLRYYHELTIAEIARVLGVSERTVHNRLHYAHLDLISKLDAIER